MSMLFSRRQPAIAKIAEAFGFKSTPDAESSHEQPPRRPPSLRAVEAVEQLPVIKGINDIPKGDYLSFKAEKIPEWFKDTFAVIRCSDIEAVLLVALEAADTHPQFALRQILIERGIRNVSIRKATVEIIGHLHEENRDLRVEKSSGIEEKAWALIETMIEYNASDIHIETRGSFAQVFFRIFGERVEQPSLSKKTAEDIAYTLYQVHGDADNKKSHWDPKVPCDTTIPAKLKSGKEVQLRFSSVPITPSGNFRIVMRALMMDGSTVRPLEVIGYTPAMVDEIRLMLLGSKGIVLLVGPPNSGKSTSLQSMIEEIYAERGDNTCVLTVEDPVEYIMRRASQIGVPDSSQYSTYLKASLRQDPDVLMIGEIRDSASADTVKTGGLAGLKLLASLHVFEAFAVYTRLRELGVPESLLFMDGYISGIIYQRLVKVLCKQCSIPVAEAREQGMIDEARFKRVLKVADLHVHDVRVRSKSGCKFCNYTGIRGRTICAEVIRPDAQFLEFMRKGNEVAARRYLQSNIKLNIDGKGVSALAHAIHKMRKGMVDPAEVERGVEILSADNSIPVRESEHAHLHESAIDVSAALPPSLQ